MTYFTELQSHIPSLKNETCKMKLPIREAVILLGKVAKAQRAACILNEGVISRIQMLERWKAMEGAAPALRLPQP